MTQHFGYITHRPFFGENMPARDLLLSPDHAVLVGDALIQAGALVDGTSIVREAKVPKMLAPDYAPRRSGAAFFIVIDGWVKLYLTTPAGMIP